MLFSILYINDTINKHLLFPYAAHFGRCSKEGTLVRLVQMDSGFTVVHANVCPADLASNSLLMRIFQKPLF